MQTQGHSFAAVADADFAKHLDSAAFLVLITGDGTLASDAFKTCYRITPLGGVIPLFAIQ